MMNMMGMGWLMMLFGILVIIGIIAVIVWGMRLARGPRQEVEKPLATLQRRHAAGEISADEYEQTRSTLLRDQRSV